MTTPRIGSVLAALTVGIGAASAVSAQSAPTSVMATRPVGETLATSDPLFRSFGGIRVLSDGRLIINDPTDRQVIMLDADLKNPVVLIDSTPGRSNSFGAGAGGVIAHLGDSTLFVDRTAQVMVVLDPAGKPARTTPLPAPTAYLYLAGSTLYGRPVVSPAFGLVYEAPMPFTYVRPAPGEPDIVVLQRDTSALLSYDMTTRRLDTLALFSNGRGTPARVTSTGIQSERVLSAYQFRIADSWVGMADGSVGLVRGREFRIDWFNTDGTRSGSKPIAHEWQRITDDDKIRMADSVNRQRASLDSVMVAAYIRDSTAVANGTADSAQQARMRPTSLPDLRTVSGRASIPRPAMRQRPTVYANDRLTPDAIPDYLPAIEPLSGSVHADADNNVWIRINTRSTSGDRVYDIVNREGVLVDRVTIPLAKSVVGFGPGGIVYLSPRVIGLGRGPLVPIERVRWRQ